MPTWSEFERQAIHQMKPLEPNFAKCTKCSCTFFEQVHASKFNADQSIAMGQGLVPMETHRFLRCVKCGESHEPMITYNQSSPEGKQYDAFRQEMERSIEEKKEP